MGVGGERHMIIEDGLYQFAYYISGSTATRPQFIGEGTGTTAPVAANAALITEIYPTTSRNAASTFLTDGVITWKMSQGLTDGSTTNYAEHGLFTNSTTGVMYSRQTYPDTKKTGDVIMDDYIGLEVGSYLP